MNRHVNAISGRLSLRQPQRESLEILHRITEIAPPGKEADTSAVLEVIRSEYPSVTDFEREFPSLCFALATGVGKTRLMGAFVSYLHLAHGICNFFVLAPNLTIYNKLIADFTPNTPKYVFKGIAEFATDPPVVITGDTYESGVGVREAARRANRLPGFFQVTGVHINIFNISKINSEVRGGNSVRYFATRIPLCSRARSLTVSCFFPEQRISPMGVFSSGCRSYLSSQRRYNSICPLSAGLNSPSFNSMATNRFKRR